MEVWVEARAAHHRAEQARKALLRAFYGFPLWCFFALYLAPSISFFEKDDEERTQQGKPRIYGGLIAAGYERLQALKESGELYAAQIIYNSRPRDA